MLVVLGSSSKTRRLGGYIRALEVQQYESKAKEYLNFLWFLTWAKVSIYNSLRNCTSNFQVFMSDTARPDV